MNWLLVAPEISTRAPLTPSATISMGNSPGARVSVREQPSERNALICSLNGLERSWALPSIATFPFPATRTGNKNREVVPEDRQSTTMS